MPEIVSKASRRLAPTAPLADRLQAEINEIRRELDELRSAALVSSNFGDKDGIVEQGERILELETELEARTRDLDLLARRSTYTGF